MLSAYDLSRVDDAVDIYCQTHRITKEHDKKGIQKEMVWVFLIRQQVNSDMGIEELSWLDSDTLLDIFRRIPRID